MPVIDVTHPPRNLRIPPLHEHPLFRYRFRRIGRLLMRVRAFALLATTAAVISAMLAAGVVGVAQNAPAPEVPVDVVLGDVPDLAAAVRTDLSQPSTVVAADGSVIARFRPEELFVPIAADALPPLLSEVVVAAEDEDFWDHRGFDATALVRATVTNFQRGSIIEGGSTITQQVVKNLFTGGDRTLERKIDELKAAIQLERHASKEEILAGYLNTVFFGEGAIGAEAAARTYFRKPAHEVTLSEAALLAGVIPAPTLYNPRDNPEAAEQRRLLVLERVAAAGVATPAEIELARASPPVVHPRRPSIERYPYFVDYVRRWLLQKHGVPQEVLYGGGLRIETTLQPDVQDAALASVNLWLPEPDHPEAAAVVIDPTSGDVKALIGGRSWERQQVNLALGALGGGSGRQPGSSFKPFVLARAYEDGASSLDLIGAPEELHLPRGHVVHNYTRRGYGTITLAQATQMSVNTSFVALANFLDVGRVAELARAMGLESLPREGIGSSLAIGAYEVSPLEMATAYSPLANGGHRIDARPVQRILGPNGEVIADWTPAGLGPRVLSRDAAALVTHTLQGVILSGTGRAAAIGRPAAGKTGTSNDYSDAWFVGYTPQLVTAVWVGFPGSQAPMINVAGVARMTGGSLPARIWRDVMDHAQRPFPVVGFPTPPNRPPAIPPAPEQPPPPPDNRAQAVAVGAGSQGAPTAPSTNEEQAKRRGNGRGRGGR